MSRSLQLAILSLLAAAPAAAEEPAPPRPRPRPGDLVLGVAPSYAYVVLENKAEPNGGGVNLFLHYHLSSGVALRAAAGWSGHAIESTGNDPGGTYQVVNAALGLRYAFDLIPLNPAVEGGVGILQHRYQDSTALSVAVQFGVAVDTYVLPWLSVGAAFHYHAFLSNPSQYPVYFDLGPRVGVRWP
jgi:hypothetical protein